MQTDSLTRCRIREALLQELPAIGIRIAKVFRVYNQRYGPTLLGLPEAFADLRVELEIPGYACVTYRALMNGLVELDRELQAR